MITATTTATFKTLLGKTKRVRRADPMFCMLDKTRVRFGQMVDADTVEVLDNDGNGCRINYGVYCGKCEFGR